MVFSLDIDRSESFTDSLPIELVLDGVSSELQLDSNEAKQRWRHRVDLGGQEVSGWGSFSIPSDANPKNNQIFFVYGEPGDLGGTVVASDAIAGPMLAHKAEDEGIACAENVAGQTGIVNHDLIPGVVYTWPEFAGVGLTQEEAIEKMGGDKSKVKVGKFPMMANSRAKTNHEPDGFVKVISEAESDRVLGVWCINNVAGTMIAQAAQAMEFGATSEDIAYTCHAHPTHSEALKEAAMAVQGKAIHV